MKIFSAYGKVSDREGLSGFSNKELTLAVYQPGEPEPETFDAVRNRTALRSQPDCERAATLLANCVNLLHLALECVLLYDSPMRLLPLLVLVAGCAGGAPIIDDLQMPQASTVGTDGYYSVEGLLSFHDDDGVVNKIRILIPAVNQTYEFDAAGGLQRGTLPLVVKFSSLSPRGPMAYDVSLVNAAGTASVPRAASVFLQ
jgi:hypothetical protein